MILNQPKFDAHLELGVQPNQQHPGDLKTLESFMERWSIHQGAVVSNEVFGMSCVEANASLLDLVEQSEFLLAPVARLNPFEYYGSKNLPEQWKRDGFKALKLEPDLFRFPIRHSVVERILMECREATLPLVVASRGHGVFTDFVDQLDDEEMLVLFSDVFYGNLAEVLTLKERFPNIFVDSHYLSSQNALPILLENLSADHVMLGSGGPVDEPAAFFNILEQINLDDEDVTNMLHDNAHWFFLEAFVDEDVDFGSDNEED